MKTVCVILDKSLDTMVLRNTFSNLGTFAKTHYVLPLYAVIIPYSWITGLARVCSPEECPAPAYVETFETENNIFLHFVFRFVYLYLKQLG